MERNAAASNAKARWLNLHDWKLKRLIDHLRPVAEASGSSKLRQRISGLERMEKKLRNLTAVPLEALPGDKARLKDLTGLAWMEPFTDDQIIDDLSSSPLERKLQEGEKALRRFLDEVEDVGKYPPLPNLPYDALRALQKIPGLEPLTSRDAGDIPAYEAWGKVYTLDPDRAFEMDWEDFIPTGWFQSLTEILEDDWWKKLDEELRILRFVRLDAEGLLRELEREAVRKASVMTRSVLGSARRSQCR